MGNKHTKNTKSVSAPKTEEARSSQGSVINTATAETPLTDTPLESYELPALPLEDKVLSEETVPFDKFQTTPNGTLSPLFNVISLKGGVSRRNTVRQSMDHAKMNFRFHLAEKDTKEPLRGSVGSHKKLYQKCVDSGAKWIAVCEDNLISPPREVPTDYFNELIRFIEKEKFDIIYLGAFFTPTQRCRKMAGWNRFYRAFGIHGAMCYIISREMCQKMLDIEYRKKGIDIEFTISDKVYMYRKLLFYRSTVKSTQLPSLDTIRSVWFRESIYTRCEDKFFDNSLPESTGLAILILVILIILLIWIIMCLVKRRWVGF